MVTENNKEKEYVCILTEYMDDTYSYSGISEHEIYIHKTREGAERKAEKLKLKIVEYCKNPRKEATIEKIQLED